jgi:hypothetical protein
MRNSHILAGTAILGATVLGGTLFSVSALATTARSVPVASAVQIYAPQSGDGIHGTVVVTGAIGDYGKTVSIDQDGKTDANGNYVKVTLQKGTFEINSTAANAVFNKLQPTVDKATCSAAASAWHRPLPGGHRNRDHHGDLRLHWPAFREWQEQGSMQSEQ